MAADGASERLLGSEERDGSTEHLLGSSIQRRRRAEASTYGTTDRRHPSTNEYSSIQHGVTTEFDTDTGDEVGCCGKKKPAEPEEPPKVVGFFTVFKYADFWDGLLMVVGTIAALGQGAAMPLMIIVFGQSINSFTDTGSICSECASCVNETLTVCPGGTVNDLLKNLTDGHTCTDFLQDTKLIEKYKSSFTGLFNVGGGDPTADIMDQLGVQVMYYVILGSAVLVTGYIQIGFWSLAAHRQSHRIKMKFFSAILNQNIGWFDCNKPGELSTRLAE